MLRTILLCVFAATMLGAPLQAQYPYAYLYKDLPFKMPRVPLPKIPKRQINLLQFGGVGDGKTLNTKAFDDALTHLHSKGGGKLVVPAGVWYTGPIVLRSNINLHLEKGAVVLFTTDKNAYPLIVTTYEGKQTRRCQSPISGRDLTNIAITGHGAINGSGQAWRPLKRAKVTEAQWRSFVNSGGVLKNKDYWVPSESSLKGELLAENGWQVEGGVMTDAHWEEIRDFLRPVMVSLVNCKNILLQGVLFENSPSWNIHPLMCENLIVDGVVIRNPSFAQNGDGLDLESCRNAIVVNSFLDVGDDAICIKSGRDEEGRKRGRPTENVIIDNCIVLRGHGGFVVGSEMSGGARNISVTNCKFIGTHVGLRFKSTRGRGGVVENIFVNNISMVNILNESFLFDLYYGHRFTGVPDKKPVDETTPVFRNIFVRNIVSRDANKAMFFNGLPEMNIQNIVVENATFTTRLGIELSESDGIELRNVTVTPSVGPALLLHNVKNLNAQGLFYPETLENPVQRSGNENHNILINSDK